MSPYGYKVRLALTTNRIAFKQCDQPLMLPRLALQGLGIQYRRIPLLAIGKDIYCDSTAIVARLQEIANPKILSTTPADMAFEAFSTRVFWGSWPLIPAGAITPEFARDRKSIARKS
jgi:glutathione S-transferase